MTFRCLLLAALIPGLSSVLAQTAAPPASKSSIEARFEKALKFFPDADADKDGKLSMEEALKYVESHPELKDLMGALSKAKAKGPGISKPGALSTPASAGLPPGPRATGTPAPSATKRATPLPWKVSARCSRCMSRPG